MTGKVLSVASECAPLLKTGGLADVVGALPGALGQQGWDMRVLMPAYRSIALPGARALWATDDLFGGPAQVLPLTVDGAQILLLDAPHLFDRPGGPYSVDGADHIDNPERFAALSWAASQIARHGLSDGWQPDILHAHDWQAGLAPAYLAYGGPTGVRSIMTIHNIAFQGIAPAAQLGALRLPAAEFHADALEYYGQISTLKAGLITADAITTVSPTYADELMRPEFGMGMEGVIAARASRLHGILNGVDTDIWNPETDPAIARPYGPRTLKRKADNRAALMQEFGLSDVTGPLAIVVSRLTDQKGIDLILAALPDFIVAGGGLAVLGTGDPALEAALARAAAQFPGRVGLHIGYDEALAHRMFAGGDAVLVPSRFEPCGLTQMYGLRYGTLPVVAATGGLADTVITANAAALDAGSATGITFHPTDALALSQALRRLAGVYADPARWAALQRQAMRQRVDWTTSSAAYATLYRTLLT
ncbi:glycogen synthase GlgA [Pseudogemmobacter sp. W21_MBD1_M6]|uniref:glycogen synthase GlgA n=1 Tax=Pseudogemmobacter sp. W21_MBD1_M6 TaxID=3240271 RepID=UPI003F9A3330